MRRRVLWALLFAFAWPASSRAAEEPTSNGWIRKGAELFKHQDYEGARAAFARAYEIEPKAATLFNLALSELNADHPVEAAAHLRGYLAHTEEPAAKLDSVRSKWLPRAEARTARLNVFAPAGAQVAVDGIVQDPGLSSGGPTSPRSFIIVAGEHDVRVRQGTFAEDKHIAAQGGELVDVHFQQLPDAPARPAAIAWSPGSAETREQAEPARSRAQWITVMALGSGAVVAAGMGLGFEIASANKAHDAQNVQSELAGASAWNATQCAGANGGSALCHELRSDVEGNRHDWTLSVAAYVSAGVLAAASAATWMWWKPKSAALIARPMLGPRSAGFALGQAW